MSLLPLLFSAWWTDLDRPHRIWDQNFGLGFTPDQLMLPTTMDRFFTPMMANRAALEMYYKPLVELMRQGDLTGTSTITADKDMFKVILDVQQFKPEEITVRLVDNFVVVEAKHEEKRDEHGLISRQFMRKYMLPEQVDRDKLESNISSDGILTIKAPLKQTEEKKNERTIKIELTGKPAIRGETTGGTTVTSSEDAEQTTTNQQPEKPEK